MKIHQILLNTIRLENKLMTFTEKTMMASNHVVENTTDSITETIIVHLLTKLTSTEKTKNPHHDFSPTGSMFLNQTNTDRVYQNSIQ